MNIKNKSYLTPWRVVLVSALLLLGSIVFPPLFIVFVSLFVGIYIAESVKMGIVKTMGLFLIICLGIGLFISPRVSFMIFSLLAPLLLGFHYCISANLKLETTIAVNATLFFISLLIMMYTQGFIEVANNPTEFVNSVIASQEELFKESGLSSEAIASAKINIRTMFNFSLQLAPSIMVLLSLFISYLSFLLAGNRLLKEGIIIEQPGRFIYFRLPKGLFRFLVILALVMFFFGEYLGDFNSVFVTNIFFLFSTLLFIQGVAIVSYFTMKFGLPLFFRYLIVLMAVFTPGLQLALIMIALMDSIVDFRKLDDI